MDSSTSDYDSMEWSVRSVSSEAGDDSVSGNGVVCESPSESTKSFTNGQLRNLLPTMHNGSLKAPSPTPSYTSRRSRSSTPFGSELHRGKVRETPGLPLDEFRMAAMQGNLPVIKSVLKQGVAVDQTLKAGWTCLMYASSSGRPQVVLYLLQQGANPNLHKELFTPLMAACASSRDHEGDLFECVEALVSHGARVNVAERHRMTPLMFASKEGRLTIVQHLLKNKADVNKQDNKGWTALCWAATRGHGRVVRLLLQHFADPHKMNSHGQQPADVAISAGYPEIADILDRFSASGCMTNIIPGDDDSCTSPTVSSDGKKTTHVFGELEMVLTRLDLSSLIPLFQKQEVSFEAFLQLSDQDLETIGVKTIGHRKKLLLAIRDIHKKEWESSSLPNIKTKDSMITLPEAVSMVTNINKHIRYIHASIGYLRGQLEADPKLLQLGQEVHSVSGLATHCGESLKYLQGLYNEIKFFKSHLDKVSGNAEYATADLIVDRADNGRVWQRRLLASLATTTAMATILWYSRPKFFSWIFNLSFPSHTITLDV